MRLTLRTLLAYLDDVLDASDKEELSQKIESSEFAEDLMHRTRDTMRRLRLSAPQVIGTGTALDPNTVSEYLDNVLPPEQVGDFERICLESDVHLAEAAACHHVLTMVLGEPADVDPRARQRMYGIPAEARDRKRVRLEPAHVPAGDVARAGSKPAPASATAPISHQPTAPMEIPEYLRTGSWWKSRGALAALAVVLLVGASWYLMSGLRGWFGGPPQMTGLTLEEADEPAVAAPAEARPEAADEVGTETVESGPAMRPLAPPPQPLTPGIASPMPAASEEADRYTAPNTTDEVSPDADLPEGRDAGTNGGPPMQPPATEPVELLDSDELISLDGGEADAEEPDRYAVTSGDSAAAIPRMDVDGPALEAPGAISDQAAAGTATPDIPPEPAMEEPAIAADAGLNEEPAGPRELGTYLGGKTVLLRYDEQNGAWFRVEPRDAARAGDRLLALPEFRPKVTLASGVHMDISGGSQIVMAAADEVDGAGLAAVDADVAALEVVYGRIILINTSMNESRVRLKIGPHVGDVRLARSATLGVEVERRHVPGNDPRQTVSLTVARLIAPDGGVIWQDAAGENSIDAGEQLVFENGQPGAIVADATTPEWIDQEPVVQLSEQRFGAPVINSTLVSDRPAGTQLLELFQGSSRKEVKSLVARSSVHVGVFAPFVDALRDSEQRPNWKTHIEALRAAMALNPESAEMVWQALVEQRGERAAADLYEMLCGYNAEQIGQSPEQLKMGALARLVEWLEEDSLDYRVLAVHNLAEITGKRLMSNPAASSSERAQAVRRWRSRLEAGELQPLGQQ
jgi:hypothetical protein